MLGCGGSARAVVAGLQQLKIQSITVIGRKKNSLEKFLKDLYEKDNSSTTLNGLLQEDVGLLEQIVKANLIVNTTPVGMGKKTSDKQSDDLPLGKDIWQHLQPKPGPHHY